jgi:nucleoside-diphosphate kinase
VGTAGVTNPPVTLAPAIAGARPERYKRATAHHRRTEMAIERTLSIIKPDATHRNLVGAIIDRFERRGLRVVAQKRMRLTTEEAERFYAVHAERPFYRSLVEFMASGPVVVQVLEGPDAIMSCREIMGATDPAKAAPGTIRKDFAQSIEANSVHGSDSPESAAQEITFFFSAIDIFP